VKPIRQEIFRLRKDPLFVEKAMKNGADEGREIAVKTLKEVKTTFGFPV